MKKTLLFIFLLKAPLFLFSQQIWHVKSDATGSNTGLNWQDAFSDLQSALHIAHSGDDIWVAAGTYKPTTGNDRAVTFDLPTGVRLAGGFAGTEILFGDRNWTTHITTLSGDIGDSDDWEDNSYHVVRIYGGDTLTVFDGFSITGGNANIDLVLSPIPFGGGVLVMADLAKPISVPTIQNCTFIRNKAYYGGGIGCFSEYQEHVAVPHVKDCNFQYNLALAYGGGVFKRGNCETNRPFLVENCEFKGNYSFNSGGGIAIFSPNGHSVLNKNTFVCDSAFNVGGGVYLRTTMNTEYTINECTFLSNFAGSDGSALYQDNDAGNITLNIQNTFFASNIASNGEGGTIASISGAYNTYHRFLIENCRMEHNVGRGILIAEQSDTSDIRIDRCYFLDNVTDQPFNVGGGFSYYGYGGNSINHSLITNSVFAFNDGAVASRGGNLGLSQTTVVNCTFLNNGDTPFYKNWYANFDSSIYQKMQILNSIIWEEDATDPQYLFYNNDFDFTSNNVSEYLVEHSLIHVSSCEYEGVDPCGAGMVYNESPSYLSTEPAAPDLSLAPGSPAINKGSNLVADTFDLQYDFAGHPRIQQNIVDIGAFESDSTSGAYETFFQEIPFLINLTPNVQSQGRSIRLHLFNPGPDQNFLVSLMSASGSEKYRMRLENVPNQTPFSYSIPTENLTPGIYLLSVQDSKGGRKTQKFIIL
ncbi:MAG TPA: choice-of-anchor Q domain-containing protein [Smithellaceae bacterium]|nr:choice-of-anchor Q domain-containing protein [Smithellaceae bacterium]